MNDKTLAKLHQAIKQTEDNLAKILQEIVPIIKEFADKLPAIDDPNDTIKPRFIAKVDGRGRITIRDDVRKREDIFPGDYVAVFELEKVE